LRSLTTGGFNTAIGQSDVMAHIVTGTNNTAIGCASMVNFSGASSNNTAVGAGALSGVSTDATPNTLWTSTGSNNCAFGASALSFIVGGGSNVGIGSSAQVIFNTSGTASDNSNQLSIQNVIFGIGMNNSATAQIGIGQFNTGLLPSARLDINGNLKVRTVSTNPSSVINYLYRDPTTFEVKQAPLPSNLVTSSCINGGFIPMWSSGALACSIISQSLLANCTTGTHLGVGIGGAAIATTTPIGGSCTNLTLTVYGSSLATGGSWILSDRKFKTNIHTIESALSKINKIRGVSYDYDVEKFPEYNFSESKTLGFIAQELGEVIPEAVSYTEKDFYAVNYDALIPVLTEGIKEQQMQIETLKMENENFKSQIEDLQNKMGQIKSDYAEISLSSLEVTPNPINGVSVVKYKLNNPESVSYLVISDLNGKLIKQVILNKGSVAGQIEIGKQDLAAGMYIFSLVSNNMEVQSKKVLVTE
jgi:hypothetical protein